MLTQSELSTTRPSAPSRWSDLSGMTVLVTGASSGIGRATAFALAACGADLVLLARSEASLSQVCSEIELQHDVQVRPLVADLVDTEAARDLIAALPRLNALVNNAGHNIPQPIKDVDQISFDTIFALNVKAAF